MFSNFTNPHCVGNKQKWTMCVTVGTCVCISASCAYLVQADCLRLHISRVLSGLKCKRLLTASCLVHDSKCAKPRLQFGFGILQTWQKWHLRHVWDSNDTCVTSVPAFYQVQHKGPQTCSSHMAESEAEILPIYVFRLPALCCHGLGASTRALSLFFSWGWGIFLNIVSLRVRLSVGENTLTDRNTILVCLVSEWTDTFLQHSFHLTPDLITGSKQPLKAICCCIHDFTWVCFPPIFFISTGLHGGKYSEHITEYVTEDATEDFTLQKTDHKLKQRK